MVMAWPPSSIIAPPDFTKVWIGVIGAPLLPWKKRAAAPDWAASVPPVKLNVAVGLPVVWKLAVMFGTEVTDNVPPFRFTVPALLTVLLALREMSSRPQLRAPVPLTVSAPVPRLATKNTPVPPLIFIVPPLTFTWEDSPAFEPLAP